jgi:hypothetical protein
MARVAPRVSVIIPVHNRAAMAVEAVRSVHAQTFTSTEVIVVDDGSTDGLRDAVAALPGVTYLRQEHSGSGPARTRGLGVARGDLVASLDSDDLWHPDFLERTVAAIDRHDADFVFANWVPHDGGPSDLERWLGTRRGRRFAGARAGEFSTLDPPEVRELLLSRCPAPSSGLVLRRASMPPAWNAGVLVADDWYLLLEMALARPTRAAFTLEPLWSKRRDGANKYDGREAVDIWRELNLHDKARFRRDFGPLLTPRERAALRARALRHAAEHRYLQLRRALRERGAAEAGDASP